MRQGTRRQAGLSLPVFLLFLVLAVAALAMVLPRLVGRYLLTPDLIEARIVRPFEEASGRSISLDSLEFGLGGLRFSGLTVGEDPSFGAERPFLEAERLEVRLDWLALFLRRQVSGASVAADGVSVELRRGADGRLALASLFDELSARDTGDRPASWSLVRISIRNGRISLSDDSGTVLSGLDGLELDARGILGPERRDLSVRAKAERASHRRLVSKDLSLRARLAGQAVSISGAELTVAGGRADFEASLLSGEQRRFAASLSVRDIDLSRLVPMLSTNKELNIDGSLSGKLDLRSEGAPTESMAGEGQIDIPHGRISGSKGLRTLAAAVGVEELATLELENAGGSFEIGDGRVSSERMLLGGKDARLIMKGSVGFDSSLDLQAWVGIGPGAERAWLSVGSLLPHMRDKEGWTNIAVAIRGKLRHPRVTVPTRALAETMVQLVPNAAELIIKGGSDATGTIIREGVSLPGTILKEGAEGIRSVLDELERVLEGDP